MDESMSISPALSRRERSETLAAAQFEIDALSSHLGGSGARGGEQNEASQLMKELHEEVAEFGAFPDVIPFTEASFAEYGWPAPAGFEHLNTLFNFYWVRFPIVLKPATKSPFNKLEYQIEFGTGIAAGNLKPKAHLIFPAKKFTDILNVKTNVELGVQGNVQASATAPAVNFSYFDIGASAGGDVSGSIGGDVAVKIGPFDLTMRRAEIDHSAEGAQKVYWLLSNTRLIREDNPSPVVVLQVPKEISSVGVQAQLQAFHSPSFGLPLTQVYDYLTSKIQSLLGNGAPIWEQKSWQNILPSTG